ncbi:MAG: alkaline phosphatase [Clostridia bacterium]|nr:alkaline phosphatase [Clostridia bacterium]
MKKSIKTAISVILTAALLFCAVCIGASAKNDGVKKYKNVILFIGDGMGINTIRAAKQSLNIENQTLNMESFPVQGWSMTRSLTDSVTDSAAGGTALATGFRTYNGGIGNFIFEPLAAFLTPLNLTDVAIEEGKATGVITTDKTDGATPGTFSAHAASRNMSDDICGDQLRSKIDLIWGGASDNISKKAAENNGFTFVTTTTEMNALEAGERSFGQFSYSDFGNAVINDTTPSIEQMTMKAIELLSADEDGFFLMVEGAHIDKKSHSNLKDDMAKQLYEFDKAVGSAYDYAKADGDTLIVITADHETGGITLDEKTGNYYYTTGSHTGANVPVFVSATDAGFENGAAIKNRQVARNISDVIDTNGIRKLGNVEIPFFTLFK